MVISPIITRRTVKERAELLTAGERIEGKGVIFTGQLFLPRFPCMEMAQEKYLILSQPVIVADNEKEAIKIANDSKFGLSASIWT